MWIRVAPCPGRGAGGVGQRLNAHKRYERVYHEFTGAWRVLSPGETAQHARISGMAFEWVLLVGASLMLLSIAASRISARLGVPVLLLFIAVGMLAGSDGPGGIYFDNPTLTQWLGVLALVLILFSGGLDTDWRSVRPVLQPGLSLATAGVALTAGVMAVFAVWVLGLSWLEGLLLGAIVSSTDAAAVFTILRARETRLKGRLEPLIELESGSNDPMAVFLTLGMIQALTAPAFNGWALGWFFIQQMTLGAALGYGLGRSMAWIINRIRLDYQGLYPALTLGLAVFTYAATSAVGGNGFLAVYLAGLTLGNRDFVHRRSLRHFHDSLAWLMQVAMFLVLGLQVFPSRLWPVAASGLMLAGALMLVARPLSVWLALLPFRLGWREKALVSWAGLRGAAPIILATFPYLAGLPQADLIFHVVFFVVLTSVLLQGTTIGAAARWLRLESNRPPPAELAYEKPHPISEHLTRLTITPTSPARGWLLVDLNLPSGVLVVLMQRGQHYRVPSGSTVLHAGDSLLVLGPQTLIDEVCQRWALTQELPGASLAHSP